MFAPVLATTAAGDVVVNATTHVLVLTEYSASVSLDINVQAGSVVLALTTYPATVDVGIVAPEVPGTGAGGKYRRSFRVVAYSPLTGIRKEKEKRKILLVEEKLDLTEINRKIVVLQRKLNALQEARADLALTELQLSRRNFEIRKLASAVEKQIRIKHAIQKRISDEENLLIILSMVA